MLELAEDLDFFDGLTDLILEILQLGNGFTHMGKDSLGFVVEATLLKVAELVCVFFVLSRQIHHFVEYVEVVWAHGLFQRGFEAAGALDLTSEQSAVSFFGLLNEVDGLRLLVLV